jgi:hypothetical protein
MYDEKKGRIFSYISMVTVYAVFIGMITYLAYCFFFAY